MSETTDLWQVVITPPVRKAIARMSRQERERLLEAISHLAQGPYEPTIKRLHGRPEWRLRVGDWRVLLHVDWINKRIVLIDLGSRGDVYKK